MDPISSKSTAATSSARSSGLSESQRNAIWENGLKESVDKARNPGPDGFKLGSSRIDRYEGKVKEDMKAFLEKNKDNPNLTEAQIQDELKKSISKRQGYEFVNKMTDDYFFNKLMSRAKELSQDTWS
jgi:hypothetical protein